MILSLEDNIESKVSNELFKKPTDVYATEYVTLTTKIEKLKTIINTTTDEYNNID